MHIALLKPLAEPEVVLAQGGRSVKIAKKTLGGLQGKQFAELTPDWKTFPFSSAGRGQRTHSYDKYFQRCGSHMVSVT